MVQFIEEILIHPLELIQVGRITDKLHQTLRLWLMTFPLPQIIYLQAKVMLCVKITRVFPKIEGSLPKIDSFNGFFPNRNKWVFRTSPHFLVTPTQFLPLGTIVPAMPSHASIARSVHLPKTSPCSHQADRQQAERFFDLKKNARWAFNLGCSPRFSTQNQI